MEDGEVAQGKMRFEGFDIVRMVAEGAQLLGSEGREYDCDESGTIISVFIEFVLFYCTCSKLIILRMGLVFSCLGCPS